MYYAILTTIGTLFLWAVFGVVSTALGLPDVVSIVIPLIATSIWAGFDAHKIEFKKYKTSLGSTVYGGGGVFAAVLLLWIIFFPWYLFSREKILSGKAKLRDEYEGEFLKGSEIMEENKEYQSMAREDAMAVLKSRRKKSKFWYVLGVITAGLIIFCLFFRVVTFSNDFTVIAKKHPTFSSTFVDLDDYIKRGNDAVEEYNADGLNPYMSQSSLETYLRRHGIDPVVYNELWEKGLIGQKGEDSVDSKEITNNDIERFKNMQVAYLSDVGPTITGLTLGGWLEQLSNGLKETTKLKIVENDSNIIVKIFSKELNASFFFSPQGSNVCIITEANVNGEISPSSIEALQLMNMFIP